MSVNRCYLLGRLGQDPQLKTANNGTTVCTFSLATSERKKDAGGTWVGETTWHNIVTFGATAENVAAHLAKGSQCLVEGKIQNREWEKDGEKRRTTEIVAQMVHFVGSKGAGQQDKPKAQAEFSGGGGAGGGVSFDSDSDIPF